MPKIEPFEKYSIKYDKWFRENKFAYQSEINAIKDILPRFDNAIEIGIGTGKFAVPLGIKFGVEPSARMRKVAQNRGLEVMDGVAENLPLKNDSFDLALMVTTLCFLDDARKAFAEIYRILKPEGYFINGFIDGNSDIGKIYQKSKKKSIFYKTAIFYSVEEVIKLLKETCFKNIQFRQTIFRPVDNINKLEPVKEGYGKGSFIVFRAQK